MNKPLDEYEMMKICIDSFQCGELSGWLYTSRVRRRLFFGNVHELSRGVFDALSSIKKGLSDEEIFGEANGYLDFETNISLPWRKSWLFTRKGKLGAALIFYFHDDTPAFISVVENGKNEFFTRLVEAERFESIMTYLAEIFTIKRQTERKNGFKCLRRLTGEGSRGKLFYGNAATDGRFG